jgi:predicted HAD superfamily Cof-like phosphohydrolase
MENELNKVIDFHIMFKQPFSKVPTLLNIEETILRVSLMEEENKEYYIACLNNNLEGIADALGDQLYILLGTIIKHGMQDIIKDIFYEIHKSNMTKLDANNLPILREDGKILKGPNYVPPDLKQFLNQ